MEQNKKPLVSVLTPVYNTKDIYLKEAIESVQNQTLSNFELLIADDGSTNNIEDVIKSYSDIRIKYFKLPHQGVAKTRNFLLDNANGKYVAWLDSDDIALKERLQTQYDFLEENPDISLCGGYYEIFYPNSKKNKIIKLPIQLRLLEFNKISQGTCMMRLADINKFNLRYNPDFLYYEDPEFFSRVFRHLKGKNIPKILNKYRYLDNSLSHSKIPQNGSNRNTYARLIRTNLIKYISANEKVQLFLLKSLYLYELKKFRKKIFSIRRVEFDGKFYLMTVTFGIANAIMIGNNKIEK